MTAPHPATGVILRWSAAGTKGIKKKTGVVEKHHPHHKKYVIHVL